MIQIPPNVQYILNTFKLNGYDAYIVGGCVRDSILNKTPNDWDITTNCKPEITQTLFNKTVPTGIKHGTITVILENENFEVTTFRTEGIYINNRTPSEVNFVSDIKEDLARRDFTINAMAFNPSNGLIDYFNGVNDLKNGVIKAVGNSDLRFKEDALRMLRAIRFSTTLNFTIEAKTFMAINKNNMLISNISMERINEEFCKILLDSNSSYGIVTLIQSGLLHYILPELCSSYKNNYDKFQTILHLLDRCPNKLNIKLALLLSSLSDSQEEIFTTSAKILRRLKFDNNTLNNVCLLIKQSKTFVYEKIPFNLKKFINKIGIQNLNDLFVLQILLLDSDIKRIKDIELTKNMVEGIVNSKEPLSIKDLAINGNDLLSMGIPKGTSIGLILNKLLDYILENPNRNTNSILMNMSKDIFTDLKNNINA
ncbi:CCA tRNA nucleotidyltransferase [Clostridium frigidicarnis]|uniref:tRNA nucleotidyltransferase (CCA-adding enzyme) n=1 Tax=Clostridium frigidicarnis TaxID=84698 RepID=A0A1I1AZ04_9CLOT|nr:CCA tRNA nucleotidyltransferase [Clostridium frigidicarnis]SFB42762.1 tRNA nucleotidyltransferase (CCA-adding enzyme) [Clostridium frigidicarnis]